jgi:hypothetical protein
MRATNTSGPLSVQAISGTCVILLGINMMEAEKSGVLGFGIQRTDLIVRDHFGCKDLSHLAQNGGNGWIAFLRIGIQLLMQPEPFVQKIRTQVGLFGSWLEHGDQKKTEAVLYHQERAY